MPALEAQVPLSPHNRLIQAKSELWLALPQNDEVPSACGDAQVPVEGLPPSGGYRLQ